MSIHSVAALEVVGGAVLALWLVVRFPTARPRTLGWSAAAFGCVLAAQAGLPSLSALAVQATGSAGALVLVLLPYLTLAFWAAMWVVQALSGLVAPSRR